ncbi:hypothetical protein FE257_008977 [Aspergillus nanangensis]|uniref:Uncharacterized protein n=1 Tax=Aspergillus nanangensis TaxID=2582783 RepID=A0AAD4CWX0_ASPNN|nr:hypothetical protein FE257_008977 [Aspergillus nanangensis]
MKVLVLSSFGFAISTALTAFAGPVTQGGLESAGLEWRSENGIQNKYPGKCDPKTNQCHYDAQNGKKGICKCSFRKIRQNDGNYQRWIETGKPTSFGASHGTMLGSLAITIAMAMETTTHGAGPTSSRYYPASRARPASQCGLDIARTPDGTLWNDLPYLAPDMTELWLDACGEMSRTQRLNASTFLAKLASTRVANDQLCQIALTLCRLTFETEDHLGNTNGPDEEDKRRTMSELSIAELLPSVCAWFREAGHNLTFLSELSWNDCTNTEIGRLGYTFEQSGFGHRCGGRFSPWRWLYWLKQLHLIADEAAKADEPSLVEAAKETIEFMLNRAKDRQSTIIEIFKTASDPIKNDEHLHRLH